MKMTNTKRFTMTETLKYFRKITAYVLIFSLLWQNSLWAVEGLYILEEELNPTRVRTYGGRKAGIVDPGTIRDNEIHNVFEDLQLTAEGGVIFKGAPDTTKIYNRIYSADPVQLSGVIEADYPLPMVFANPGGIILENPDFQNIHDLTLAAGTLAQTNEGMAFGVDRGLVFLNKTFVQADNDIQDLTLAGRGIRVEQSFLSPVESLILRAGQHVKGWNSEGEWVSEDYFTPNESPLSEGKAIFLDDVTTLSAKGLFIESLEEGAMVDSQGVLQATESDIVIRARGDVYINRLSTNRNLKIKTTGRVHLGRKVAQMHPTSCFDL
jgi:filamentous hemagglutinin family protein